MAGIGSGKNGVLPALRVFSEPLHNRRARRQSGVVDKRNADRVFTAGRGDDDLIVIP